MTGRTLSRVLYVEDESDIQTVAKLALEVVGGLVVQTCDSGEKALAQAQIFSPDLILLDVMMPGMDGPSTLKALRAQPKTANIPVIFMTAKVQPYEIERYRELGAIGVIPKPFDPMTLAQSVRDIWTRHGINA